MSATAIPQLASETAKSLCRIWSTPELSEKNISFAINQLLKKINTQVTNIPQLADMVFRASFFTQPPYSLNIYGNRLSLPVISQQTVSDFDKYFIRPENTTILVSGDFDEKEIENVIKKSLKKFSTKKINNNFMSYAVKYKFNSNAPVIVADLPSENNFTNQFTRVFSSPNSDAIIVCGIPAPGFNSTNYPRYITKVVRAALQNQMDNLNENWTDYQKEKPEEYFFDYQARKGTGEGLFELPVLGFFAYGFFALELYDMYYFVKLVVQQFLCRQRRVTF